MSMPRYICRCKDIEFGSYDACVTVVLPWAGAKVRGIDACMVPEVAELWRQGIRTVESCCGHNQKHGYVAVEDEFFHQMIALGYAPDLRSGGYAVFLSKTEPEDELMVEG